MSLETACELSLGPIFESDLNRLSLLPQSIHLSLILNHLSVQFPSMHHNVICQLTQFQSCLILNCLFILFLSMPPILNCLSIQCQPMNLCLNYKSVQVKTICLIAHFLSVQCLSLSLIMNCQPSLLCPKRLFLSPLCSLPRSSSPYLCSVLCISFPAVVVSCSICSAMEVFSPALVANLRSISQKMSFQLDFVWAE